MALDIALTKTRPKHGGERHPHAVAFPYIAAEGYLLTLIRKGFRVRGLRNRWKAGRGEKNGGYKSGVKRMSCGWSPRTLTEESLHRKRGATTILQPFAECGADGPCVGVG